MYLFCESCRPAKQEERRIRWRNGQFYNSSKIMKLMPFISITDGTSKQHKMMPQKDFYQSFKTYFVCILIGILTKFSVDPYYEPL